MAKKVFWEDDKVITQNLNYIFHCFGIKMAVLSRYGYQRICCLNYNWEVIAAWQCELRRWLCSENWAFSTLAWIQTDVISSILTFRQYPKFYSLIFFTSDRLVFNVELRKVCRRIQISLKCLVGVVMWENVSWTEDKSDQSRKIAAAKFVLYFCTSH